MLKMTIEERKQDMNCYLEQLEEEIETLKENISEFKGKLEKAQTDDDFENLKYFDMEKGLNMIELF